MFRVVGPEGVDSNKLAILFVDGNVIVIVFGPLAGRVTRSIELSGFGECF